MRLTFLGGAREVGRLGCVVEHDGTRLLVDYGLAPSDPPKYPAPAPPVDGVFLTHAHLDHAGMMPALAHEHGASPQATPPTIAVSQVLAADALNVHAARGYPQPYSDQAPRAFAEQARPLSYQRPVRVNTLEVTGWSAGHIPGSTMYSVSGERTLVFTGDLNTAPTRLVDGARPAPCHTLVMESTYAGRTHPERGATERAFLETVRSVVERGGTVVVPAFAVGRTQEVLLVLATDAQLPIYLDGLGARVTDLFLRHPQYLRSAAALKRALSRAKVVRSRAERQQAARAGNVILTTSGMLEGGPVLQYLDELGSDPKNAFLLTGYQVEGTNGRLLLEERSVRIGERVLRVEAQVGQYDFSAHADHDALLRFAEACTPESVVLMHSDDPTPLAREIESFARVHVPKNAEPVTL